MYQTFCFLLFQLILLLSLILKRLSCRDSESCYFSFSAFFSINSARNIWLDLNCELYQEQHLWSQFRSHSFSWADLNNFYPWFKLQFVNWKKEIVQHESFELQFYWVNYWGLYTRRQLSDSSEELLWRVSRCLILTKVLCATTMHLHRGYGESFHKESLISIESH